MARRRSKRKRPRREDFMLGEQRKVEANLNRDAMILLSKFYNKGVISRLLSIIATGKESDIYIAEAGSEVRAMGADFTIVKFFRTETSMFSNMADYLIGDPRFKGIGSSKTATIRIWCRKEFGNLEIAREAGVDAPRPYMFNGTILAMEYICDKEGIAQPLNSVKLTKAEAEAILERIIANVRKLYVAKLVHGDLSEYNILVRDGAPVIIDFGQAVSTRHPHARAFLRRDVSNLLAYFRKNYGIEKENSLVYSLITGRDL